MKSTLYVEYHGKQIDEKSVLNKIKNLWTTEGKKVKDINSMDIYLKPEENAVYYVINDDVKGCCILDEEF